MSFERSSIITRRPVEQAVVKMAVRKGVITREQYKDITGEDYA